MTDWTQICPFSYIQNLCLYDKLNFPLLAKHRAEDPAGTFFACCPFAGPIAIANTGKSPNSWTVGVFMQNGAQIASFSASAVFQLLWTKCQKLAVVSNNGRVLLYDVLGKLLKTSTMGDETMSVGLAQSKIFSYANEIGLAVLNNSGHFFLVNSVNTPLLWRIQSGGPKTSNPPSPTCWTVLTSNVKPTRVLICSRNRFFVGEQETSGFESCNFHWARSDGQYLQMELDVDQCQLLLLHDSKLAQLVDVEADDFLSLRQIKLDWSGEIGQLFWCGKTAFALEQKSDSNNNLKVYTLEKLTDNEQQQQQIVPEFEEDAAPSFTFSFPSPTHFHAELDGIRVFTKRSSSLLLPVQDASKAVLGLGSNEPGALLFGAAVKLEQRSHASYEFIRSINAEKMPIAVDHCLSVAANHFDTRLQKQLLKAASMGMRRCQQPPYDADKFVRICRLLRMLNALRLMGTPLTFPQLEALSPSSMVDRLVALGHWPMAVQLCDFLELELRDGVYKVLAHWCLAMMTAFKQKEFKGGEIAVAAPGDAQSVRDLAQRIVARLRQYPAISYADIAEMAARQDLPVLAEILLDLETNVSRQVTTMLKLKQLEKALQKAAQSQQPDLLHLVLRHFRNNLSGKEVEMLLKNVPQALSIYQSEIRDEAPERLLALYEQNEDFIRQAIYYLQRAGESTDVFDVSNTTEMLGKAEKALRNLREPQTAQLVAESAQLISENMKREEKYGTSLSHLSVRGTFIWAAEHEELTLMEQLRKQHRLNEKQVFLWTIEGFALAGKWQQLEQFARSRKSLLGYLPVIELCSKYKNNNLATRFIDKLAGYEEQVRAYLLMNEFKKAATLAAEKSDLPLLQQIRRRVPPSSPAWAEVGKIIEGLTR